MRRWVCMGSVLGLLVVIVGSAAGGYALAQGPDGTAAYILNMRAGPGAGYDLRATLPVGTGLVFEARSGDLAWLLGRTEDGAQRGWVASLYLNFRDGFVAARLPVSGEVIAGPDPLPAADAVPASAPLSANGVTAATTGRLNVRRGPGLNHAVLAAVPGGTLLVLEGRSSAGDWVLGRTADGALRGWLAAEFLTPFDLRSVPVVDEVVAAAEPPMIQQLRATPVVATATGRAAQIYQRGLARGNHPDRFSKVGDCQSIPEFFLGPFDFGEYRLGADYAHLQGTIDRFAGSFGRDSAAVWSGFSAYAVLDPTWANPAFCLSGESPIACEYRLWQPSFVIISLEVWHGRTPDYVDNLRQVLDFWIAHDVVPILATKADNREADWSINSAIASLGWEYDIPLWNWFMAAQPLPGFGVYDGFHLTFARNHFDDPAAMRNAWPWRNLTALQSLDAVWRGVAG